MTSLDPTMRVGRQVEEALRVHGKLPATERKARSLEAMALAGLPDPEGRSMGSLRGGRALLWLEAGAVFGCSFLFDLPPWELKLWSDRYIPLASDVMLYGGFTLLWLVTLPRRKKEKSRGI